MTNRTVRLRPEFRAVFKTETISLGGDDLTIMTDLGDEVLLAESALFGTRARQHEGILGRAVTTNAAPNDRWPAGGTLTMADLFKAAESLLPRQTYVVSEIYSDERASIFKGEREHFTLMGPGFWAQLEAELIKEKIAQASAPYGAFNPTSPPPAWFGVRPFFMDKEPKDADGAKWHATERARILKAIVTICEKACPPSQLGLYDWPEHRTEPK